MVVTCSSQSPLVLQGNQGSLVNSLQVRAQPPFRANSFSSPTQKPSTSPCGNSFPRLLCAIVVTALEPCWRLVTVFLQAPCQPRCWSIPSGSDLTHIRALLTTATAGLPMPTGICHWWRSVYLIPQPSRRLRFAQACQAQTCSQKGLHRPSQQGPCLNPVWSHHATQKGSTYDRDCQVADAHWYT
jgi:hypothetical protein